MAVWAASKQTYQAGHDEDHHDDPPSLFRTTPAFLESFIKANFQFSIYFVGTLHGRATSE